MRWYVPLIALLLISIFLAALSYITPSFGGGHPIYARDGDIGNLVNVDEESNLPTWFSVMLLGGGGLLYLLGGWIARVTRAGGTAAYVAIFLVLQAMSLDDAAQLHETLARLDGVIASPFTGDYAWLIVGLPLAGAVVLVALISGVRLPAPTLALLMLGFALFFSGAVGMEALQAAGVDLSGEPRATIAYHVEELLEMIGSSVLLVAPLAGVRISRTADSVTLGLLPRLSWRRRPARAVGVAHR